MGDIQIFSLEDIPKCKAHIIFEEKSTLDSSFRGGFWKYATERFFYLYEHMITTNLHDVFHIESDNLIYYDMLNNIDAFRRKSMWCVMDAFNRCIPSFMYIKSYEILLRFLDTYVNTYIGMNDMQALARFRNSNEEDVGVLPIINKYIDTIDPLFYDRFSDFNVLFDAAAIGQYIGGVDPRNIGGNTSGFINETSVIKPDKLTIEWIDNKPILNSSPLVNLHIHSKDLKRWSNYHTAKIISGEKIQELCDVYLGKDEDFSYNPRISKQLTKCINIDSISSSWNNPNTIFCYSHRLTDFSKIVHHFENDFILVTHNSDENITSKYECILNAPKLKFWHAQNAMISHPKLGGLPIGFANSMWRHANIDSIKSAISIQPDKDKDFYFYFSTYTNSNERNSCKSILEGKALVFGGEYSNYTEYLVNLARYKFAICPPGNGIDCHRTWECISLNVIPILIRSQFSERINSRFPCVLIDTWDDFNADKLLSEYKRPVYSDNLRFKDIKLQSLAYM
jgi:hypothetical protein